MEVGVVKPVRCGVCSWGWKNGLKEICPGVVAQLADVCVSGVFMLGGVLRSSCCEYILELIFGDCGFCRGGDAMRCFLLRLFWPSHELRLVVDVDGPGSESKVKLHESSSNSAISWLYSFFDTLENFSSSLSTGTDSAATYSGSVFSSSSSFVVNGIMKSWRNSIQSLPISCSG